MSRRYTPNATAVALLLALVSGFPAAAPASPQAFSITNWGHKDGLPSTTVHAITQSADGYLWLATGDGLVRFDRFQFAARSSAGKTPSRR